MLSTDLDNDCDLFFCAEFVCRHVFLFFKNAVPHLLCPSEVALSC